MKEKENLQDSGNVAKRKAYQTPRIEKQGSLTQLTLGGSGTQMEGGSGMLGRN